MMEWTAKHDRANDWWVGCLILIFVLGCVFFAPCAGFAGERSFGDEIYGPCPCGCESYTCDCDQAQRARNRHEWVFRLDRAHYNDIHLDHSDALYSDDGMLVVRKKRNHSWGITYSVPPRGRNNLHWRAQAEIKRIEGGVSGGIGLSNGAIGYVFDIDRYGNASLRLVDPKFVNQIETFTLRDVAFPLFMILDYDVKNARLTGAIQETGREERKVFSVLMPYYGMPAIATIDHVALRTTTRALTRSGSVLFGAEFRLHGE